MNCLVVDDDILARTFLRQLIGTDPSLVLIGECDDAIQAYREIITNQIDILFLDIEMPGMTGIELVKSLEGKRPMIIFTTSTVNYAAEAFDLNVVDFLIKPIVPVRFLQSVEKAREILKTKNLSVSNKEDEFVFIRDSNVVRRIKVGEILYIEAMGDYVKIYIEGHVYSIHSSLKSVEQKLSQVVFLRVHRSFIINVSKIDTLEGGTLIINKMLVPVSDAYRSALNKRMQIL
ncbi:LytTR family DNA-binding domain-containing protein [Pedobacter frigoris]|uniref:LytR/AlgR family response regulator transcription factor n=1 Tax=Pedobacter frigoris TaxID=2571272 RepID=UPI00292D43F2|nr:LytTR family DNA-binding domain-containing protein [Pedobacter frigoris]